MKNIFTSDLNVLLQLYAPENYTIQLFDPFGKLIEDEEINWYRGTAEKNILINLGNQIEEYRGKNISEYDTVFNFGNCLKHSHTFGKCFSFIIDKEKHIRWYHPKGKIARVLPFYNASGARGKFIASIIKVGHFLGASSLMSSGKMQVLSKEPLKIETFSEIKPNTEYSVFTGAVSAQRTALLALFDSNKVSEFVKVPMSFEATKIMKAEKLALKKVSKLNSQSFIHALDGSAHPLLLKTKNLEHSKSKKTDKLTQQHVNTILELANQKQTVQRIEDTPVWEKSLSNMWYMKQPDNQLIQPLYQQLIQLKNTIDKDSLTVSSAAHGDFTPWNILHSKNGLALYDFELYSDNATPLYDLFHFIYQRGILMRQDTAAQIEKDLKKAFKTFPELEAYLTQFNLTFNTCHQLYLLSVSSYFGAIYSKGISTIQHQWQVQTWSNAIQNLLAENEKAAERSTFILRLNNQLQKMEHAFLKFNFESITNIPTNSDLDIAIRKMDLDSLLAFCENEAQAKLRIRKKSFMTTVELFFDNNEFLSLDFIYDFKRKGKRMFDINALLSQSEMSKKGVRVPQLKHDLEYALLFYTLNNSSIPKKYADFFNQEDLLLKFEAVFYLNNKYDLDLDNILELFFLDIQQTKAKLLKVISSSATNVFERYKLKFNYLLDTLTSLVNHQGFIITFSGVDGAGKSTVIDLVKQELSDKYRKEVVLLRHRPGILPMLNSYRVGKKKAEELATVNLPRKGANKSFIGSVLRFSYYLTDYLLGQVYVYFKYILRGKVVLYDRYYFDFITDPKRSNIQLDSKIVKALYRLISKPKLNFFLYADSSVILKRKKELDAETIDSLSSSYRGLFKDLSKQKAKASYITIENLELQKTLNSVFTEVQKVA